MYFHNRFNAGQRLSEKLLSYENLNPVVISIPRGGTEVAAPLAGRLKAPLYVITPRKIGIPRNREFAVGALAPDGTIYLDNNLLEYLQVTPEQLENVITAEKEEMSQRLAIYGAWGKLPSLNGQTAILVDDGIATGQTVKAALHSLRNYQPKRLILAVPVLPLDAVPEFEDLVDELVYLEAPFDFRAVGQFYSDFSALTHEEIIDILEKTNK